MSDHEPVPAEHAPAGNPAAGLTEARSFLRERFGTNAGAPRPLRHGEWSRAYAFHHDAAELVVRFSASREDFEKDRIAARYASPALPIPRVVEIGEALGGWYAISERAPGGHLDDLDGAAMRRVLPALFATLDAARRVDLSGARGYGLWGADGSAPHATWRAALLDAATDGPERRIHGWRARLAASPTGIAPFEEAFARLTTLVDAVPEERHLVHSDLLHFNVLVDGPRITGLIDWGSSLYGDFLYDVAWLCFFAPWSPAWDGIDFRAEAARYWAPTDVDLDRFDQRLDCYQLHIGLDALSYCAFTGRFDELATTAQRTLAIARAVR